MDKPVKHAIITGGTSGLGFETCKLLLRDGKTQWHLHLTVRDADAPATVLALQTLAERGPGRVYTYRKSHTYPACDLSYPSHVLRFASEFNERVDRLILNAGVYPYSGTLDSERLRFGVDETLLVNHVSSWYLCSLLKDRLGPESRVLFIGSSLYKNGDVIGLDTQLRKGQFISYATSKMAMACCISLWAKKLKGVQVIYCTPGFIPTTNLARQQTAVVRYGMSLMRFMPWTKTLDQGAMIIFKCITGIVSNGKSGVWVDSDMTVGPLVGAAADKEVQEEVWETTEKAVKVASLIEAHPNRDYSKLWT